MNSQNKRNFNNRIFVVFPGVGKTTYALHYPGVVDLDFGNFRSALGIKKEHQAKLFVPFSKYVRYYYNDGFDVLTNDPGLIPLLKQFGNVVLVLPIDTQDLVERVKQRAKGNPNHSKTFAEDLERNIDTWVNDWEEVGVRYHIPVLKVKYFEEVLNHAS